MWTARQFRSCPVKYAHEDGTATAAIAAAAPVVGWANLARTSYSVDLNPDINIAERSPVEVRL
jgi:hypothetical protein